MDQSLEHVFDRLADGQTHSGQALAEALGVSRSAIWKKIESLRDLGLPISARSGGGYGLNGPIQRPSVDRIGQLLDQSIALDVRFLVDSTNACLLRERRDQGPPRALIAEAQSLGQGRRERPWTSPPGAGLYLSLFWRFESGLTGLSALSLVTGIAVAEALQSLGLPGAGLKWPNDLFVDDRKLGGCLINISGSAEGPCEAITGVGINLKLGQSVDIDQPWTDLARQGLEPDRNLLCAEMINAIVRAYGELDRAGFGAFESRWSELDALKDRPLRIISGDGHPTEGVARGVDSQGRLLLEHAGALEAIANGEVSVRFQ